MTPAFESAFEPAFESAFETRDVRSWTGRLWNAVADGDDHAAGTIVLAALDAGLDPETVLLDVIGAVQLRVGREWAANRMSVAREHAATAINDRAIAALRHHPRVVRPAGRPGSITVACVDGEWHALPARLLAEVLTLRGWRVDYLGAQVPTPHLITHLHRNGPDVVALSSSIATRLPAAHAAITACQAAGVPVLVGGAAFGVDGRHARLLGADAWAPDARAAADHLAHTTLPRPARRHEPIDDLPHLADQEYTLVARTSRHLVKATMTGLADRFPQLREYTDLQRRHTAEDVAHIVDFLAAALYTDDADLFGEFLAWTADILAARDVPAYSLVPTLDLLAEELRDFPRATRLLTQARDHLVGPAALDPEPGKPA